MDKKKGLKNVATSIIFKFLLIVLNIVVRRFIISYIGNEINGLNSLYISILDVLSVAELGVTMAKSPHCIGYLSNSISSSAEL